jgi:hypothetical protein
MLVGRDDPNLQRLANDAARRGELRLDNMSQDTVRQLQAEGIGRADLERIAGSDRVIRGDEFKQLFALLQGQGTDRAGRSTDVARAQRVYDSIGPELDRSPATINADMNPTSSAGLRGEMHRRGAPRPGTIEYAANDLPDVRADRPAPERPNWFVRMLEFLFQWLPGVDTDDDRLRAYGRDLADHHESDILAFREAYDRQVASGPADIMGRRTGDVDAAMVNHLADRFQAEQPGMSRDDAVSRAQTVVTAMNARLTERQEAAGQRAGDIPGLAETQSGNARRLAKQYFAARDTARSMGRVWEQRLDRAMAAPPATHPIIAGNPARVAQAQNAVREENVKSVSYLMALQRSGQLSNVPPDAVDGLLAAHARGEINTEAVADTANALQNMPAADRDRLIGSIRSLPEPQRAMAWAQLGREHIGLRSTDATTRAGALARVELAAQQLRGMTAQAARTAFEAGTIGLVADQVQVHHRVNGRDVTTDVPVYFHPGVPENKREHYKELIAEAYGRIPRPALQAMLRGEGGRPFNVQVLPEGSMYANNPGQSRPTPDSPLGGYFRSTDNMIRLNMHEIDRSESSPQGRDGALNTILHESSHYLDDLGDPNQDTGFFIDHDAARSTARTQGDGDLAPAWSHFSRMKERHHELTENMEDPLAREYYRLGRRGDQRTDAEDQRFHRLERHFAALSGSVSSYGAHGGDDNVRSPGIHMGEWFAETNAAYLNPSRRDHLRAVDPVGYQMAAKYNELLNRGVTSQDALRQAARYSLSTEVSAQQGGRILTNAGSGPLTPQQLRDLNGIADGFEMHARALDGWEAYQNNAGLKTMRKDEALAGVREGRTLLGQIDARLATLDRNGQEYRDLSATRGRLDRAITQLETRANRL